MVILLQKTEFEIQMSTLSNAGDSVKKAEEKLEITGNMISLQELLGCYSKMSDFFKSYGKLLKKDAKQMKGAADSLMSAEKRLLE